MASKKLESFSKEDLEKIVLESADKADLANKLGFTYTNGKVYKKIINLVNKFEISIDHFDSSAKVKGNRIHPVINKICPVCSKGFKSYFAHGKYTTTCSHICSNTFYSDQKHSPEQRLKTSHTLLKFYNSSIISKLENDKIIFILYCKFCNKEFSSFRKTKLTCSRSCLINLKRNPSKETRQKLSLAIKQRIADGHHKGWSSRFKVSPSFPEKITFQILSELNLSLERELKVDKYFIDFADKTRKIALEIDGKQHELPERKAKDLIKDQYLISQGWTVFRIKWKKLTEEFREELKNQIIDIFD